MHGREKIMVDVSFFIAEVQKREALWNSKCPDYSDRYVKTLQWEELVEIFGGTNLSFDDQKQTLIMLRRKWKNLRDSFVRELRQLNSNGGTGLKRKSQYMWFNQLEFLKDFSTVNIKREPEAEVDTNVVDSNIVDVNSNKEDIDNNSVDGNDISLKKDIKIETHINDDIGQELGYMQNNNSVETDTSEMDSDKLFLLSLLDDFKRIPEKCKMRAKCEILNIINWTLQRNGTSGCTQPYGHNYMKNNWRNYCSRGMSMQIDRDPLDITPVSKRNNKEPNN